MQEVKIQAAKKISEPAAGIDRTQSAHHAAQAETKEIDNSETQEHSKVKVTNFSFWHFTAI